MGCDIHMYVEFCREPASDKPHWQTFGGQIYGSRDYDLFGKLAGVRTGEEPLFPVRGLPNHLGYEVMHDSILYIDDERKDQERYCTLVQAESWKKHGSKIEYKDGKPYTVTDPDAHTHSWLTTEEFLRVLMLPCEYGAREVKYSAILAAMQEMERRGLSARLVFWFDN